MGGELGPAADPPPGPPKWLLTDDLDGGAAGQLGGAATEGGDADGDASVVRCGDWGDIFGSSPSLPHSGGGGTFLFPIPRSLVSSPSLPHSLARAVGSKTPQ